MDLTLALCQPSFYAAHTAMSLPLVKSAADDEDNKKKGKKKKSGGGSKLPLLAGLLGAGGLGYLAHRQGYLNPLYQRLGVTPPENGVGGHLGIPQNVGDAVTGQFFQPTGKSRLGAYMSALLPGIGPGTYAGELTGDRGTGIGVGLKSMLGGAAGAGVGATPGLLTALLSKHKLGGFAGAGLGSGLGYLVGSGEAAYQATPKFNMPGTFKGTEPTGKTRLGAYASALLPVIGPSQYVGRVGDPNAWGRQAIAAGASGAGALGGAALGAAPGLYYALSGSTGKLGRLARLLSGTGGMVAGGLAGGVLGGGEAAYQLTPDAVRIKSSSATASEEKKSDDKPKDDSTAKPEEKKPDAPAVTADTAAPATGGQSAHSKKLLAALLTALGIGGAGATAGGLAYAHSRGKLDPMLAGTRFERPLTAQLFGNTMREGRNLFGNAQGVARQTLDVGKGLATDVIGTAKRRLGSE